LKLIGQLETLDLDLQLEVNVKIETSNMERRGLAIITHLRI